MGAPIGNRNGVKANRIWGDELRKAIAQDGRARVRKAIEALLDAAAGGDLAAAKEIADRLDGKPTQAVEVHDETQRQPIQIAFVVNGQRTDEPRVLAAAMDVPHSQKLS
ncbi:MAG: hypothetical protein AABY95_00550 [Pseudomonadota bacterium]